MNQNSLKHTLDAPAKKDSIPASAQWLSGEGAGSWFHLIGHSSFAQISRYSPDGKLECRSNFVCADYSAFNPNKDFTFVHLSHCAIVNIIQEKHKFTFLRKDD